MNKTEEITLLQTLTPYGDLANAYQGRIRFMIRQRDRLLESLQDLEAEIRNEARGFDAVWEAFQALQS